MEKGGRLAILGLLFQFHHLLPGFDALEHGMVAGPVVVPRGPGLAVRLGRRSVLVDGTGEEPEAAF